MDDETEPDRQMKSRSSPNATRWAIEVAVVALLYYGAASLGLRFAFEKTNASPVWPSSGVAFAAALWLGYRVWPGIAVGAFLANVVGFLANRAADPGTIVATSVVIAAGNTLEAVSGTWLLRRFLGADCPFSRAHDVFRFVAVALLMCAVSASIGPTAVSLGGLASSASYATVWFTWWLGDVTGVLVVTPLLLTWRRQRWVTWMPRRYVEAALLLVGLVLASRLAFGEWLLPTDAHYPLEFLPIPLFVWAAFRFGPREAATAAFVTSGIAVSNTVHGVGPFARATVHESLLLLQAFVGIVTATIQTMAAVVAEHRAVQAALRTAHDELERRVHERTEELVRLTETLRVEIAERERSGEALRMSEAQRLQLQKMEALGRLAGGIAHDFNNLLTVIAGRGQILLGRLGTEDPLRREVELIEKTAARAAELTKQVLAFGRKQMLQPIVLNLNAIVENMRAMLERLIGEDIEPVFVPGPELGRVKADPVQLEQVIVNLAVNARDAMPHGGRLTLETANVELDERYAKRHSGVTPGRYVMVAVSDTGIGMDQPTLARLFEPFFTTKDVGRGTGLGLATVYGIVKQSGGNIWAYSEPGRGTTFKVYLPRVEESPAMKEPRGVVVERLSGTETVLVVEDDDEVRALAGEILVEYGYRVLQAGHPNEAMVVAERHGGPIHLLVTDVVMPQMSGRRLAAQLAPLKPEMKVLYISGYADNAIVKHGVLEREVQFLSKPFTPDALARKVREVLAGSPA